MYNTLIKKHDLNVWLDISTLCNAKCPQCHRTNPHNLQKQHWLPLIQWSLNDFKKAFPKETLKYIHNIEICGTWGDPITNNDIVEIVEYIITTSNCFISINTNGSLKNTKWWFDLGKMTKGRLAVYFAIEGIDQEMHSKYRINTNLKKILNNMEAFSKYGDVRAFCVVFEHNEDYLEEIYNLCKVYKSKETIFFPSNRFGDYPNFEFIYKDVKEELRPVKNLNNNFFKSEDSYKWTTNLTGKHKKDISLKL